MKSRKKNETKEKLQPIDEHWQVFQPPERCDNFFRGPQLYDRAVLQYICSPGTRGSLWQWPLSWGLLWSVMVMSTSDAGAGGGGRAGCSLVAAAVAVVGRGAIVTIAAAPAVIVQNYYQR